ncbi:MAG TPA: TMEM175 family protein [Actinomycetota bacterium]|nr:TMEM175 family protein [Actinomycetota bacterium]
MSTARLETFSDGVLAIIITIMVLELGVPHEASIHALGELTPVFLAYALSFVNLGIYWNNHHHMLATQGNVTGGMLWANLHLLFWLSLFPFMTAWMGENDFASVPVAFYGAVSLMAAIAYYILQLTIIRSQGPDSPLAAAVGRDAKGKMSPVLYAAGIIAAHPLRALSLILYVVVAVMWLVPDRRIERTIGT